MCQALGWKQVSPPVGTLVVAKHLRPEGLDPLAPRGVRGCLLFYDHLLDKSSYLWQQEPGQEGEVVRAGQVCLLLRLFALRVLTLLPGPLARQTVVSVRGDSCEEAFRPTTRWDTTRYPEAVGGSVCPLGRRRPKHQLRKRDHPVKSKPPTKTGEDRRQAAVTSRRSRRSRSIQTVSGPCHPRAEPGPEARTDP